MTIPSQRYWLQTFGCQMNMHDSDRMEESLRAHGWSPALQPEEAGLVVFNTCSVREKAEQKLRSQVGLLAPLKRENPALVVAVVGCLAQQEGAALLKHVPHIDLVLGPDHIGQLPIRVAQQQAGALPEAYTSFDNDSPIFLSATPEPGHVPVSAWVTTMKGCDERCSFCIVPFTRGSERYRPSRAIVEEIAAWVAAGAKEVVLLGQTVDSYRDPTLPPPVCDDPDESQFPELLRLIAREVPTLTRLRYTSPHPRHATPSLVEAHAELDMLARHVHLPVQSGSDRILKRMIRRYTHAEYRTRAAQLLAARPGMTLSTDVIVGFPGETEEDFQATLSLVRDMGMSALFGFKFSPRPYTPALRLKDDVPEEVKADRLARLLEQADIQTQAHLHTLVGSTVQVLVEGRSKQAGKPSNQTEGTDDSGMQRFQGRSERNEIVHIEVPQGFDPVGKLLSVKVIRAHRHSLHASVDPGMLARLPRSSNTGGIHPPLAPRRRLPLLPHEKVA